MAFLGSSVGWTIHSGRFPILVGNACPVSIERSFGASAATLRKDDVIRGLVRIVVKVNPFA
jgi:hypothetical protein